MTWIIGIGILLGLAIIVSSFVAGAIHGRRAEKASTAYLRSVLDSVDKKVE